MAFDFRRPRPGGASRGGPPDGARRDVYRPLTSRVLLVLTAAIGVWWTADLAGRGRGGQALLLGLWTVAVVAALGCLFWRPAVIVDDDAVELRNVLRDVRVPWAALEGVETRYTLTLLAGGRRHQSWAGSAPGRPSATARVLGRSDSRDHRLPDPRWTPGEVAASTSSRDLHADSGAAAFLVEQGWEAWRGRHPSGRGAPDEPVVVRWNPVMPGVAVVAAALAALLTPLM